jgi:magnesium transporter
MEIKTTKIFLIDYDEKIFQEKLVQSADECLPFKDKPTVTWIDVVGLENKAAIEKLGAEFNLHPLLIEDIITFQRPKFEDFDDYIFLSLKLLAFDEEKERIRAKQVTLIFGKNFVISFQEEEKGVFNGVKDRIRNGKGKIKNMGPDYLVYALIDAIVDGYFIVLDEIGERVDDLEEMLLSESEDNTAQTINTLKRDVIFFRKSVWPLREVIGALSKQEPPLVREQTEVYLSDVYDHTIQIIDSVETFRDVLSGMLDLYLSNISKRLNEVMKVLTIISTIFIPLTFIAGVYGMNFHFMPELSWKWGYIIFWLIIITVSSLMVYYFRKKKWF